MITQSRFSSFAAWMKALSSKRFFKGKKSALATIFLKPSCRLTDSFTPHMVSKSAITQIFGRENCCQTARSLLLHFIVTKIKFPASTRLYKMSYTRLHGRCRNFVTFFKMNITRPYTSRRGQNCNGIKCQNILYNSWRNSQLCTRKKKKVRNSLELMEIKVNVNIIVQERKRNGN